MHALTGALSTNTISMLVRGSDTDIDADLTDVNCVFVRVGQQQQTRNANN
jgi:hypothetical protein